MIDNASLAGMRSYIDDVINGHVEVCNCVRGAVERHIADLDRAKNDDSFPYHFDEMRASLALDYFPLTLRHSIGEYEGLNFLLEPWQAFGIGCIFGWLRDDDDSRRFRKVYWSMARKNGKSCMGAGAGLFLASLDMNPLTRKPESVAQVILSATKRDQAEMVIMAEALRMRHQNPMISSRSEYLNKKMRFFHNDGVMTCVGSDKPYDGLNPSGIMMDELHAWRQEHKDFYDTMITGSGSRSQPLLMILTTAGDDRSYIWLEEYRHAKNVALNRYKDEALFSLIFELDEDDNPFDEDLWIKANPNIDISVKRSYLREEAVRAKATKIGTNRFTRYHGNRLVSSNEQAFNMAHWDDCTGDLGDWTKADAIGVGIDLGGQDDFAAWGAVARFLDGTKEVETADGETEKRAIFRYEIQAKVYIAQDTDRDLTVAPFAQWINEGRITVAKFPISNMMSDILEFHQGHYFEDVAYDPAGGQTLAELMEQEGIIPAKFSQTYVMFNEPLNDFAQAMADGRLRHNGCPLLRWCAGNAVAVRDRQERWMLDKRNSVDKIDPIVAVVMGYRRSMLAAGSLTDDNLIVV